MQSADYVPGVSGWKFDILTGEFEISSACADAGSLPFDPRPITITAGEWPDCDLPANAIERYAFIGAELTKVPAEFRDSAEFKTEDFSFDRDGSDYRTTLTYVRLETQEETAARAKKAKTAGTRISLADGVLSITHDGVLRTQIGGLHKEEKPQPFVVVDGVVYMSEALIKDASISDKLGANWSIKMQVNTRGQYVAAGIGLGIESQLLVRADKFHIKCMCGGGPAGSPRK